MAPETRLGDDHPGRLAAFTGRIRREGRLLALGLALSLSAWAFVGVAAEVAEGDTTAFDRTILLALRNPADLADPIGPLWLELTARDLTTLGGFPVLTLVTAIAVGFLLLTGRRGAAGLVVLSIGGGTLLSSGLKLLFDRPRPDLVPHVVEVYTASFPSGHATMTAIAYLTLGALLMRVLPERRLKVFVLATAAFIVLVVGVSRVYLGVHWPTDVVAGWAVGFAWASLWWIIAALLQRRGRLASDRTGAADGQREG